MSGGGLRILVKCFSSVCVFFSVRQKESVAQDDTADLHSTFGRLRQSREVDQMYAACIFSPQPTECHSCQRPPFDALLFKNNSLAYLFSFSLTPSHWGFSLSTCYMFFSTFFFLPSSSVPPLHTFILVWPQLWGVHVVPVNKKHNMDFFFWPAPEETYEDWYVLWLLLTATFWARLLLLAAHRSRSWRGHISNRGCARKAPAHNLFQDQKASLIPGTSFSSKALTWQKIESFRWTVSSSETVNELWRFT